MQANQEILKALTTLDLASLTTRLAQLEAATKDEPDAPEALRAEVAELRSRVSALDERLRHLEARPVLDPGWECFRKHTQPDKEATA